MNEELKISLNTRPRWIRPIYLPIHRVASLFVLLSLSLTSIDTAADEPVTTKTNILFIFADDWGWCDLSCHDHPYIKTPNIDRLAAEGTDFHRFTVASGVCSPSRAAGLTGLFPARFGVTGHFAFVNSNANRGMPDWLDPSLPMLPRILGQAGYATGHFGKWHLSHTIPDSPPPTDYGYDVFSAFNCSGVQMPVHDDAKNAIQLIEKSHEGGKPFFINLWLHEPHLPHHTLPEYRRRFPELEDSDNVYAAVLAHADDRVGEVLDVLDRLGIAENTLVIFSSDNGPAGSGRPGKLEEKYDSATGMGFGHGGSVGTTGGRNGRKKSILQGGIGVPFIARWPGHIEAGAVDDVSWISAVDLLPTFCEIASAALPEEYQPDGVSQLAVLKGSKQSLRDKPLFWEGLQRPTGPVYAILEGQWRLLASTNFDELELYDVGSDPLEMNNLNSSHPEIANELLKKLQAWQATLPTEADPKLFSKYRDEDAGPMPAEPTPAFQFDPSR